MKTLLCALCAVLVAASSHAFADCKTSLPLQGVVSIKACDQRTGICISGAKAAYDYLKKVNDDETVVTIALNASPWRLYDNESRILSVEELADMARPHIAKGAKQIVLIASWTGVAPNPGGKSLAQKLSDSLKGFPVRGMDGFLWIAKDGALRTTRQAFTVRQGGNPYSIVEGDDVMVSLATGWPAEEEATFIEERNADGILRAGAGWDLYSCAPTERYRPSTPLQNCRTRSPPTTLR